MGAAQDRGRIVEIIVATLNEVDPNLGQVPEDAILSGTGATVDSIGFINFLVSLEQALDQRVDLAMLFTDQSDVAETESPFRTVGSLTDLIINTMDA